MLGCPGNKLACPGSSYPLTGPTLISTVKHIHPQTLGPIDPADEGTLGCCTAPQRCPQKKMSLHLPLPLRTELAWAQGTVAANFLRTTFLSDQKPAYQFPSTLCWVIGVHRRFSVTTWNPCLGSRRGEWTVSWAHTRRPLLVIAALSSFPRVRWWWWLLTVLVFRLRLYLIQTCFLHCGFSDVPDSQEQKQLHLL